MGMMNDRPILLAEAMPGGGPSAVFPILVGDGTNDSIALRNANTSARKAYLGERLPPSGTPEQSSKRRKDQMIFPRTPPPAWCYWVAASSLCL
jgi:hypothetical protein